MSQATTTVLPDYEAWLERLTATYQSVTYCCLHRLGDRSLAEQVSVQVVAALVGRPKIFKYYGLPYSGRIARLAERAIARARQGTLAWGGSWEDLLAELAVVPEEQQQVIHCICVLGFDDGQLAAVLGCDEGDALIRREHTIERLEEISLRILPPDEGEQEEGNGRE